MFTYRIELSNGQETKAIMLRAINRHEAIEEISLRYSTLWTIVSIRLW
jgi:hypothetical protein